MSGEPTSPGAAAGAGAGAGASTTAGDVPWSDDYAAALLEHVRRGDDEAELELSRAYEIGRQLLVKGVGLVELAAVHHEALARAVAILDDAAARDSATQRAAAFFAECLSPFEMAQRGYRDANQVLLAKNDELQRSRDETAEANRDLESFGYSVAHDLRAPLRTIDGFSQAVIDDVGDKLGPEVTDHLRRVRGAAQRMGQLIDDLLRLSRIGRQPLERVDVDVSALFHEVAAQARAANAPERNVTLVVQPGLRAKADAALLRIVVENLLGNAWKFTSKRADARVEVGIEEGAQGDVFFVRDNGAGFDPARAHKMFAPFQRFHGANAFEGTGIGLAIVHRIVRLHGGRIWATSTPEQGATFSFTLGKGR